MTEDNVFKFMGDFATKQETTAIFAKLTGIEALRRDQEKKQANIEKQMQKLDDLQANMKIDFKNIEEELGLKAEFAQLAKAQIDIESHTLSIRELGVNHGKHVHETDNRFDTLEVQTRIKFTELNNSLKHIPTNAKIEADNIKFKKMLDDLEAITIKKKDFELEKDKNMKNNLAIKNELKAI